MKTGNAKKEFNLSSTPLLGKHSFRNIRKGQTYLLSYSRKLPPRFPRDLETKRLKLLSSEFGQILRKHNLLTAEELVSCLPNMREGSFGIRWKAEIAEALSLSKKVANKQMAGSYLQRILKFSFAFLPSRIVDFNGVLGELPKFQPNVAAQPTPTLIKHSTKIRLQGNERGTCISMAACYLLEKALARDQSLYRVLSPEYIWWQAKQNDGCPHLNETDTDTAFNCLQHHGTCEERHWRYKPQKPVHGVIHHPPNPVQNRLVDFYHASQVVSLENPKDIEALKYCISIDHPVAVLVPLFKNAHMENGNFFDHGNSPVPEAEDIVLGHHAVVLVGHFPNQEAEPAKGLFSGEGAFVFRNSWGPSFGKNGVFGKGYGTFPNSFLQNFCAEAIILKAWAQAE